MSLLLPLSALSCSWLRTKHLKHLKGRIGCPGLGKASINQNQSASIRINQHQSTSFRISQHQSAVGAKNDRTGDNDIRDVRGGAFSSGAGRGEDSPASQLLYFHSAQHEDDDDDDGNNDDDGDDNDDDENYDDDDDEDCNDDEDDSRVSTKKNCTTFWWGRPSLRIVKEMKRINGM